MASVSIIVISIKGVCFLSPSKIGVASVTVNSSKGGIPLDPLSPSEEGVASVIVCPNKGDVGFAPVNPSKKKKCGHLFSQS